jgi:hypothetical protein
MENQVKEKTADESEGVAAIETIALFQREGKRLVVDSEKFGSQLMVCTIPELILVDLEVSAEKKSLENTVMAPTAHEEIMVAVHGRDGEHDV